MEPTYPYDIALSFASENRDYVEQVATILRDHGVKVFYDRFEQVEMWGKNLYEFLNDIYKTKASKTVMFISEHYEKKRWTTHERRSAQERAFNESSEYILPARFDKTELPGMYSTVSYIDLNTVTPAEFAQLIMAKIEKPIKTRWFGRWRNDMETATFFAELNITRADDKSFDFEIVMQNGSHTGQIEGTAYISSNSLATAEIEIEEEDPCQLVFNKKQDIIEVQQSRTCRYYHGARARFFGEYRHKKSPLYFEDFFTDEKLSALHNALSKEHFQEFVDSAGNLHDISPELGDKIYEGGVAGLYGELQGIVVFHESGGVSGAYLNSGRISLFSSNPENTNPPSPALQEWLQRFSSLPYRWLQQQ